MFVKKCHRTIRDKARNPQLQKLQKSTSYYAALSANPFIHRCDKNYLKPPKNWSISRKHSIIKMSKLVIILYMCKFCEIIHWFLLIISKQIDYKNRLKYRVNRVEKGLSRKRSILPWQNHNKTKQDINGIHLIDHKNKKMSNKFSRDKLLS